MTVVLLGFSTIKEKSEWRFLGEQHGRELFGPQAPHGAVDAARGQKHRPIMLLVVAAACGPPGGFDVVGAVPRARDPAIAPHLLAICR